MKKYYFFVLLILLASGCGRQKEKERERARYVEDSIAKAQEEKRFRESQERIKPAPETKVEEKKPSRGSLISALPRKWVLLGIYRRQKVIYIPCGADEPPHFILQDINTPNPKIYFNYGKEQKTYFISNLRQTDSLYKFNLVRYYEEEGGMTSNFDKLDLDVSNRGKELIVDLLVHQKGVGKTRFDMVPESEVKNYMIVKQDPSECEGSPIE